MIRASCRYAFRFHLQGHCLGLGHGNAVPVYQVPHALPSWPLSRGCHAPLANPRCTPCDSCAALWRAWAVECLRRDPHLQRVCPAWSLCSKKAPRCPDVSRLLTCACASSQIKDGNSNLPDNYGDKVRCAVQCRDAVTGLTCSVAQTTWQPLQPAAAGWTAAGVQPVA